MRGSKLALDVITIRVLMISCITHDVPQVFNLKKQDRNGNRFRCTESLVRRFLKRHMGWSLRRGTQAGQKVPENAPILLSNLGLRMVAEIRDENIAACFVR